MVMWGIANACARAGAATKGDMVHGVVEDFTRLGSARAWGDFSACRGSATGGAAHAPLTMAHASRVRLLHVLRAPGPVVLEVGVDRVARETFVHQHAVLQPHRAGAQAPHRPQVVRDEQDRLALLAETLDRV